jgi:hypothetical protein
MTSVSEYELLHDKNIKERGALVSTWKFIRQGKPESWNILKKLLSPVFLIALHPFKIGHGVISISVYDVESI